MPHGIMLNNKTEGSWLEGGLPLLEDWLGIVWWVVSNCVVHHLFVLIINISFFFPLPIKLSSSQLMSSCTFTFFSIHSPFPLRGSV